MCTSQGLFRSAQHKKQAEFLGRSFDSDKDRAAAAKNAFVLLAQHRPQLAAAFFILGVPSLSVSYPGCCIDVPPSRKENSNLDCMPSVTLPDSQ